MFKFRTVFLRLLSFVPSLLLLYMIFGFSSQDAPTSSSLSFEISVQIVTVCSPDLPVASREDTILQRAELIHTFVRKAAHMTEYFLLSLSLQLPLYCCLRQKISTKIRFVIGFFTTVIIAIMDEFYQTTIPGRSGNLFDVCVDSTGAFLSIVFLNLLCYLKKHKKNQIDFYNSLS